MKGNRIVLAVLSPILLVMLTSGCSRQQSKEVMPAVDKGVAVLHPTEGHKARGIVIFTKIAEGIQIVADIEDLSPGKHGFHIHEYGDCSAPDATSAGGHFNPENMPHGGPKDEKRHVGDLGNIVVEQNGKGHLEMIDTVIRFEGLHSIIGRAVVVHANEDDLKSQPTGNAGPRVSCGVIGIAKGIK